MLPLVALARRLRGPHAENDWHAFGPVTQIVTGDAVASDGVASDNGAEVVSTTLLMTRQRGDMAANEWNDKERDAPDNEIPSYRSGGRWPLSRTMRERRRTCRLTSGVLLLSLFMIGGSFALLQGAPTASAATPATTRSDVQVSSVQPSATQHSPVVRLGANDSLVQSGPYSHSNRTRSHDPLTNAYDWTGYDGNSSVYPTYYTGTEDLPSQSVYHYQDSTNDSQDVENSIGLAEYGPNGNAQTVSDYSYDSNLRAVVLQVSFVASGASGQYLYEPFGGTEFTQYYTPYQQVIESLSGLPSNATADLLQSHDYSGVNMT